MEALNEDPENKELLGRVYVILASKGRISEAAKYAEISLKKGDKNNFTYIIMAVDEMKKRPLRTGQRNRRPSGRPRLQGIYHSAHVRLGLRRSQPAGQSA